MFSGEDISALNVLFHHVCYAWLHSVKDLKNL